MLRRLAWVKNAGLFEDFKWDASVPELARINVIYGANGSGKTSLASALELSDVASKRHENISVEVESGGSRHLTAGSHDSVFDRVHVFSSDYVARAHRFRSDNPDMDPILTLGQRTAEAEEKLVGLRAQVEIDDKALAELNGAVRAAEKKRSDALERVSKHVVADLTTLGGKYQSRSHYSVKVVENLYAGSHSGWVLASDEALAKDKQLIASPAMDSLPVLRSGSIEVRQELLAEAHAMLAKTPVTIVLDTLEKHPEATSWVQEGQALHESSDTCIYCGSPLSAERKHDIERHFAGEVAEVQLGIDSLTTELAGIEEELATFDTLLPKRAELYPDLRKGLDASAVPFRSQKKELGGWIAELSERLRLKRENVLAASKDTAVATPTPVKLDDAATAVTSHNAQANNHAQLVGAAARRIEYHHLKDSESALAEVVEEIKSATATVSTAETNLQAKRDQVASLENVEGDPLPSAQVLTSEVSRLLGRTELTFESVGDRYRVLRYGSPAVGLSVGEQTAITLVHFMETIARADNSGGKPIVVIDDPVSSLDSNVFMGISTYIWTECLSKENAAQLVLLTHNFELFRQWDVQLEALHKGKGMPQVFPVQTYELANVHVKVSGNIRRIPRLVKWPPSESVRKKVRSSYQHAFLKVVEAYQELRADDTLERRLDAQLLFPNVVRRMLETFVGFKRPDLIGDFTGALRECKTLLEASGFQGDADELRQHLTRYTHTYSHDESPDTTDTVNPDEIATAIRSVFIFMDALDSGHFAGLCSIAGTTPAEVLA